MNYTVNKINEGVEGIETFNIISEESQAFVGINIIDTTNDSEELINELSIIRGDCYQLAKNIVPTIITVFDWNGNIPISKNLALIEEYKNNNGLTKDNCVVFFIVGTEFLEDEFIEGNGNLLGDVVSCGYETAEHISDLENNYTLIQTSRKNHKDMCYQYFKRQQSLHNN